jgi:hypothetical protein
MTDYRLGAMDREFVIRYFQTNEHQVQNSLAWFDFLKTYSQEIDRSVTLYADDQPVGFVLALQYKNLIQSLPYPASYSGMFLQPELKREARSALMQLVFEHYKNLCDVYSICTSPFSPDDEPSEEHFDFVTGNRILYIDLSRELLFGTTSKFRNNLKRNLCRAKDAGVAIDESSDEKMLAAWYRCYERRMEELEAIPLEYGYFTTMREHLLPAQHFQLFSAVSGDRYLGGIIIVYNRYCADYYPSIFDRDCDDIQAGTCLFHHALAWAKQQGVSYFNLQASPTSQTALYEFKKSWGATGGSHHYLVKILNNRNEVLQSSVDQVKRDYRFHYLAPFEALSGRNIVSGTETRTLQANG